MKIFVPSCSRYSATWQPHLAFMRRSWPHCPWPRVLVTEALPQPELAAGFEEVFVVPGGDLGWCQNLLAALALCDEPFLAMTLDDFWCDEPVDEAAVEWAADYLRDHDDVGCFKLYGSDPATRKIRAGRWGEVARFKPYRISTCQALWRRDYIAPLLEAFTTPGDWERFGSELAADMPERVLAPVEGNGWMRGLYSAIQRGCWTRGPIARARELGIPVDLGSRPFGPG